MIKPSLNPIAIVLLAVALVGCSKDPDGVPKIDSVENIVVDGKPLKPSEFLEKYCTLHPANETCGAVARQARADSRKWKPNVPF